MNKTAKINIPDEFELRATIASHGWNELLPFRADASGAEFSTVIRAGRTFRVDVSQNGDTLELEFSDLLKDKDINQAVTTISHILRIDEDISGFYATANATPGFEWIAQKRAGRLLRSATVFEDLVKTICTTNCSWAMTLKMVNNLVGKLSEPGPSGESAFPTAEIMATKSAEFYRDEIRAGYRAPYFAELAVAVAEGRLDVEAWLDPDIPKADLKKMMKAVKGVGDYAAENLLKLVGRYDGLALDSWLRGQFYKKHNGGDVCDDKTIRLFYERFGDWSGLAIWCDLTHHWHHLPSSESFEKAK